MSETFEQRDTQLRAALEGEISFFAVWANRHRLAERWMGSIIVTSAVLAPLFQASKGGSGFGLVGLSDSLSASVGFSLGVAVAVLEALRRVLKIAERYRDCAEGREALIAIRDIYLDEQVGTVPGDEASKNALLKARSKMMEVTKTDVERYASVLKQSNPK
jgi:hypothetical protein